MPRKRKLPKRIELIDEKRGNVVELDFDHAQRVLNLQDKISLGQLKIFNTQLYQYEQGLISFVDTEPEQHESVNESAGSEG